MRKHYPKHLRGQSGWIGANVSIYESIRQAGRKAFARGEPRPLRDRQKQFGFDCAKAESEGTEPPASPFHLGVE